MAEKRVVMFDVGGVLLSNGWDRGHREAAAETFDLDLNDFQDRHEMVVDLLETGRMTLDEYLITTIFHRNRPFSREAFITFMKGRSQPMPQSLDLLSELAGDSNHLLVTLNNESRELNEHRISRFGLKDHFTAFFSSCYLGIRKPNEDIYLLALDLIRHRAEECLLIDDRSVNIECARNLGMQVIQFHDATQLRKDLGAQGFDV